MKTGIFEENELQLCNWQYTIRHENINNFNVGEKIFLKSNPEVYMEVASLKEGKVFARVLETKEIYDFYPECVLQYKFRCLETYKRSWISVCLN